MTTELKGNEYLVIGDPITAVVLKLPCLFVCLFLGGGGGYLLIIQVTIYGSLNTVCVVTPCAYMQADLSDCFCLSGWLCLSVHDRKTALQGYLNG